MKIEQKPIGDLVPYINNSRTHSDKQVAQIAASIKEFGFNNPILTDGENGIIAGHGRLLAAQKLGLETVPVIELSHLSEAQKKAYIIADNKLAENAGWDNALLATEIEGLAELNFDIELLGFEAAELENIADKVGDDSVYSEKTGSPIYEIKGENPPISTLCDSSVTDALVLEVQQSGVDEEIKKFLTKASQRHTAFDYAKIAEFYAHAPEDVQRLMRRNALVIIDFESAIENGLVELSKEIQELRKQQSGEN